MEEKDIAQALAARGKTAPRVTLEDVEANIVSEWYIIAAEGVPHDDFHAPVPANSPLYQLTFCVLVLRNGFTVTGQSACASPENFDADIGRKLARKDAVNGIWPLMGYELKQRLASASNGVA